MTTVYVIQSVNWPQQWYTGLTTNLEARLQTHNTGGSPHTSKFKPRRLVVAVTFADDTRAMDFETYLKSGTGRAFAFKHFRSSS